MHNVEKMAKHILKILQCEHRKIIEVCLAIQQHAWKCYVYYLDTWNWPKVSTEPQTNICLQINNRNIRKRRKYVQSQRRSVILIVNFEYTSHLDFEQVNAF